MQIAATARAIPRVLHDWLELLGAPLTRKLGKSLGPNTSAANLRRWHG